jgi:CHAT domain-containing protein
MRLFVMAALSLWAVPHAVAGELGRNLADETCQTAAAPGQPTLISCAGSMEAGGEIAVVPLDQALPTAAAERRKMILRLISADSTDQQLGCGEAQWFGSGDVLLRFCARKGDGWPRILLGVQAGDKLYRAEGAPSLLPVLVAAIAADAPVALPPADASALEKAVRAKYSDGILRAPSSDFVSYTKLIEEARLAAAGDNYADAERAYRHSLDIEEKLFGPDAVVVGRTLAELGLQVSNQGRFTEAAALFRRAQPIIEASSDNNLRARLNSYLALDAANRRDYFHALAFADQATAARRLEASGSINADAGTDRAANEVTASNRGELAHSLRIEAEMAIRLGDFARARSSAEESLWIVGEDRTLPLWWRADTLALIGNINEAQGRVVQADHDFSDARELDSKLFGETASTALADFRLGEFYARQQLYPAGVKAFRAGFAIAAKDQLARALVQPDHVVHFIAADLPAVKSASDPAVDAEIFRASQLSKSGLADQAIARVAARQALDNLVLSDLVAQAQQAERQRDRAQIELAAEFAKADDERNVQREQQLNATVKLASATAGDLDAKVLANYPQYAGLAAPATAELADVQARLAPGEALLVYVIGTESSYALLARPNSFKAVPLAVSRDALAADVADLRSSLGSSLGRPRGFNLKNSYGLYRQLVEPLGADLAGVDHLIVVPGTMLSSLPLSLLVDKDPAENAPSDYQHAGWLIRRFAISEVPSPRAFVLLRDATAHRKAAPRAFLGLGNPDLHGAAGPSGAKALTALVDGCREDGPVSADLLRALPPLPDTAAEIQTVSARIGGSTSTVLLGRQATEAGLRAQPLDQYAVMYFATHGLLPGELHCAAEPGLVLSPPAQTATTRDTDGLLNASEIAELKLNADLVVLSACNTAEGSGGFGDGSLEGLSDSFFAAGARAVLASHWEIPSRPTAVLMTGVFDRASRGEGLAEALRQSQLALISQSSTAHPFHWAGFTITGDGENHFGTTPRGAQADNGIRP